MTTEPRKPGWYWVKFRSETQDGDWEALEFMKAIPLVGIEAKWFHGNEEIEEHRFESIGPRIPTPDEAVGQHEAQRQRIAETIKNGARLSRNKPRPSIEDDDGEADYRFSCDRD